MLSLIDDLYNRSLIYHITNKDKLNDMMKNQSINVYCGFDPTADSLHVGHLLLLITLKRFQLYGHKPIILIGGSTSLIGDPSFKIKERTLNINQDIDCWINNITKQFSSFLDFNCGVNSALVVNNSLWFNKMKMLSFLRDIGKHFSISSMINRESVKNRIVRPEKGISFTEFSYSLLQAYDFFLLYKKYHVSLQIGGSDQWGNISAGMHLINRLSKAEVYGLTTPLLIQKNGVKFGKTESGTIWLDPKKTSPYKFYQFWMNIEDDKIYTFLKFFTFEKISSINLKETKKNINNNCIQDKCTLAKYMTSLVHGKKKLLAAERITQFLFCKDIRLINESDFKQLQQDGIPSIHLNQVKDLSEALVCCKLAESRTRAKNMINSHAIFVNTKKIIEYNYIFSDNDKLFNRFTLITRGKKNHCLIFWGNIT